MKKRIAALVLAMGMSFVVLTGCDSGSQPVVEEQTEVETDVEAEPTEVGPDFSYVQVGQKIEFGNYNQGKDGAKPIEWIVLDVKDDKALIPRLYCLDRVKYNEESGDGQGTDAQEAPQEAPAPGAPNGGVEGPADVAVDESQKDSPIVEEIQDVTWETSSVRLWLNRTFYNTAFSGAEQSIIEEAEIINSDNPSFGTPGGNTTTDKVFLLSIDEANQYFETDSLRRCQFVGSGYCWYYLRSPGGRTDRVAYVSFYGDIVYEGVEADSCIVFHAGDDSIDYSDYAIRPAMWIKLNP